MEEEKEASGLFLEHRIVREALRIFFGENPGVNMRTLPSLRLEKREGLVLTRRRGGREVAGWRFIVGER